MGEPQPQPHPHDHEAVFLERLARLRTQASRLLGEDGDAANDLVQDAFVQFTLVRPELARINNLDAYLFGLLRHLALSFRRRRARDAGLSLTVVDFDSARLALDLTDHRVVEKAREELEAVCRYACARKDSLKAASVLILRFFHGYYPSEVAAIVRCPVRAVDEALRRARLETYAALLRPGSVAAFGTVARSTAPDAAQSFAGRPASAETGEEFLWALRQVVFSSCRGACLPADELSELYRREPPRSLDCEPLAHIVSCAACLQRVATLLSLPDGSDRGPSDALGAGRRGGGALGIRAGANLASGANGTDGGHGTSEMRECRRRARDVFEHRPTALRLAINGLVRVTHPITSPLTEHTLTLDAGEQPDFVEVFSEQGLRLALLAVDAGAAAEANAVRVSLSRERYLEVTLIPEDPWPLLRTTYWDPGVALPALVQSTAGSLSSALSEDASDDASDRRGERASGRAPLPRPAFDGTVVDHAITSATRPAPRGWRLLYRWLTRGAARLETTTSAGEASRRTRGPLLSLPPRRLATAGSLIVVIAALLLWGGVMPTAAAELMRGVYQVLEEIVVGVPEPPTPKRPRLFQPSSAIDILSMDVPSATPRPPAPTPRTAPAAMPDDDARLIALEIGVLERLDSVDALFGEPVRVTRGPATLRIEALAETRARQQELTRALAPFSGRPEIRLSIRSVDDVLSARPRLPAAGMSAAGASTSTSTGAAAAADATAAGSSGVRDVTVARDRFAGFELVRTALAANSHVASAAVGDAAVDAFAARVLDHARRARRHAWALQAIAERITDPRTLHATDAAAFAVWQRLVESHRIKVEEHASALDTELLVVAPAEGKPDSDAAREAGITSLVRLATELDDVIRSAFTVSPAIAEDDQFIRAVVRARRLTSWIEPAPGRPVTPGEDGPAGAIKH